MYIYMCVCVCVIMKTMCPPDYYHHNGFMVTHGPGHMMYGYIVCPNRTSCAQVHELP